VYYYPFKYKLAYTGIAPAEFPVLLRLSEQYLIRAEAEAYGAGNGISGAIIDLDTIRHRAGLPDYSGPTDQIDLINVILHERRVELFTEYGHRWFDMQRTNTINSVMDTVCPQKGGTWNSDWMLYPIPLTEIQADSKLVQNDGYED
jgi:starch-binding outer membrane protein, SusD/RagB family